MIKSITIKDCATYPASGATIENCQKVNFFYGPNGSGKSTIGKFLKNPTDPQYKECSIVWQNQPPITIDVYNRVLEKDENSFEAFKGIALTYVDCQDYEKADEFFKKATSIQRLDFDSLAIWKECQEKLNE